MLLKIQISYWWQMLYKKGTSVWINTQVQFSHSFVNCVHVLKLYKLCRFEFKKTELLLYKFFSDHLKQQQIYCWVFCLHNCCWQCCSFSIWKILVHCWVCSFLAVFYCVLPPIVCCDWRGEGRTHVALMMLHHC